jgi:hypothetical protein
MQPRCQCASNDSAIARAATLITGALRYFLSPPSHPLAPSRGQHDFTAPHAFYAGVDQGPTFFAVFQAVSVFHAHALIFPYSLWLSLQPLKSRSRNQPRRLVRGSCTMALPVPWCLSRRRNDPPPSPEGGKATRTHTGRVGRRGPCAAPRTRSTGTVSLQYRVRYR